MCNVEKHGRAWYTRLRNIPADNMLSFASTVHKHLADGSVSKFNQSMFILSTTMKHSKPLIVTTETIHKIYFELVCVA